MAMNLNYKWRRRLRRIKELMVKIGLPVAGVGLLVLLAIGIVHFWPEKESPSTVELPVGGDTTPVTTPPPTIERIQETIINAEYDTAKELIARGLKANPSDNSLKDWQSKLMDELKINFKFRYLPGRRRDIAPSSSSDLVLTSEDPYYLKVHLSDKCYLYVFQLDSSGNLDQLFPSKYVPTSNPVPPGPLRIPDGADWFYLDDVSGEETIYLVASRWENKKLEELIARLAAERELTLKRELIEQILSRLRLEKGSAKELPGLAFGEYRFLHR